MKRGLFLRLAFSAALGLARHSASAEMHDLFHPVLEGSLRELSTDRPDMTESPITVDAGHYQLEMDLASWHRDQDASSRTSLLSLATINFKLGLTDYADLQLGINPFDTLESQDLASGTTARAQGQGDFIARLKVNFWGDNGGSATAFGVMPFIKIPTAAGGLGNGSYEGGLILPLSFDLGLGFDLGTMGEFDFNRNAADLGYHNDTVLSASLGHSLAFGVDAYLEYWCLFSGEKGVDGQQNINGGLEYGLGPNAQLDLGVNAGITAPSEDFNPFLGLSIRI